MSVFWTDFLGGRSGHSWWRRWRRRHCRRWHGARYRRELHGTATAPRLMLVCDRCEQRYPIDLLTTEAERGKRQRLQAELQRQQIETRQMRSGTP